MNHATIKNDAERSGKSSLRVFISSFVRVFILTAILPAQHILAQERPSPETQFNWNLYQSMISAYSTNLSAMATDARQTSSNSAPLLLPGMDPVTAFLLNNLTASELTSYPTQFVSSLVSRQVQGLTMHPVFSYIDTNANCLFFNADTQYIGFVSQEGTYNPDDQTYAPSNVVVQYSLMSKVDAIKSAWSSPPSTGQVVWAEAIYPTGTVSRFCFYSMKSLTNGTQLVIAYPTSATNNFPTYCTNIAIYACTNLLNNQWIIVANTNVNTTTNWVSWTDTDKSFRVRNYAAVNASIAGPTITISSPAQNSTLTTSNVTITGTITCVNVLCNLTMYGNTVEMVSMTSYQSGVYTFTFWKQLSLADGPHSIDIDAIDMNGLRAEKWLYINVDASGPKVIILSPTDQQTVTQQHVPVTVQSDCSNAVVTVTCGTNTSSAVWNGCAYCAWTACAYDGTTNAVTSTNVITVTLVATNYSPWRTNQAAVTIYFNQAAGYNPATNDNPYYNSTTSTNNPAIQGSIQWNFTQPTPSSGRLQQIGTERQVTIKGTFSDPSSADAQASNVWVKLESSNRVDETGREFYNVPVTGVIGTERKFEIADVNLCGTNSATAWLAAQGKWSNIGITTFSGRADDLKFSLSWTATYDGTNYAPNAAMLTVISPTNNSSHSVYIQSSQSSDNRAEWELQGDAIKAGVYQVYGYYYDNPGRPLHGEQSKCKVTLDGSSLITAGPHNLQTHCNDGNDYCSRPWLITTVVVHKNSDNGGYEVREYDRDKGTGEDTWHIRDMIPTQGCVVANDAVVPDGCAFQVATADFTGPNGGDPVYLRVGESAQFTASGKVNVDHFNMTCCNSDANKRGILGQFTLYDPPVGGPVGGSSDPLTPTTNAYIDTLGVLTGLTPYHLKVTCGTWTAGTGGGSPWTPSYSYTAANNYLPCLVNTNIDVYVVKVDLNGDYNRDGNPADNIHEADPVTFTGTTGMVIIANTDDDVNDSTHQPDCKDNVINGSADLDDIYSLKLHITGGLTSNNIPDGMTAELKVENPSGEPQGAPAATNRVRIFKSKEQDAQGVIGPSSSSDTVTFKKSPGTNDLDIGLLVAASDLEMGIEGIEYGREVIVKLTLKMNGQEIGKDSIRLLVSPFLVLSNTDKATKAYVSATWSGFYNGVAEALNGVVPIESLGSTFIQDYGEIGASRSAPGQADRKLCTIMGFDNVNEWYSDLVDTNTGYFLKADAQQPNPGGNVEAAPAIQNFAYGRLIVGANLANSTKDFFKAQKVQTDNGNMIELSVDWLKVGHVDEVMAIIPVDSGFKVLVADQQLAIDLLRNNPTNVTSGGYETRAQILAHYDANSNRVAAISNYLASVRSTLATGLNIAESNFVRVPVAFTIDADHSVQTYLPNMINMIVIKNGSGTRRIVIPISYFQPFMNDLLAKLSDLNYQNGEVWQVDTSGPHAAFGEAHCGSNVRREAQ